MPVLKTGLVGTGYWGSNLCRVLSQSPRIDLRWICDGNTEALDRAALLAPAARRTERISELLEDPGVAAVVLATPVDTHFKLALAALRSGKHVLVEKPLARTSAEAEQLCQQADASNVRLMVGHTFLYNGAVRKVKDLIDAGEVGVVRYVFCQRLNLGIVRQDVDALWSLAPHDISILDYWIGAPVERVAATGHSFLQPGIADVAFAHLTYAGNVAGHIQVSWLDPGKVRRATVVGSKRMLVYDDISADAKIAVYDKGIDIDYLDANLASFQTYAEHRIRVRAGDTWLPKVDFPEPLVEEVEEFANCIEEGRPALTDGRSGLRVVRTLERLSAAMKVESAR